MDASAQQVLRAARPTFAELFTPKLVTILREGYTLRHFQADAVSGLTVAIVALPLSMAIAIASGLSPDKGLFAAIIGGLVISALGGSRFQIGGPAGAFIVLIAAIVEQHGYDGLVLATLMAGVMMVAIGFLQLGTYIKYIPLPVMVGFTAGIAVIILGSQIKELLGLDMAKEPAALWPKLLAIGATIQTAKPVAIAVSVVSLGIILGLRRLSPKTPGLLIAVGVAALATWLFNLDVATIGSRFGGIPRTLPVPALPALDASRMIELLPEAMSIALLGSIESLLSAAVADGMTGRRHRSNCELVAQGVGNIAAVAFGGMCVTGTIARTATNVRSGGHGPISGILHAVYILLFMLIAAPLAAYIPLASLGAVLAVVALNMTDHHEVEHIFRSSWGDRVVLVLTFLLTIFSDLILAIGAGVTISAFLFLHKMAEAVEVKSGGRISAHDTADTTGPDRTAYEPAALGDDVVVYRISGVFFFGAASAVSSVLDRIGQRPKLLVLDLTSVPLVDSTASKALESAAINLQKQGTDVAIANASESVKASLCSAGLTTDLVRYAPSAEAAVAAWRAQAQPQRG